MLARRLTMLVALLAMVAACGGSPGGGTETNAGPAAASGQPLLTAPASTARGAASAGAQPPAGAGSTITGTIDFKSHAQDYRTQWELKTEKFNVMVVVSLVRDPSAPGERYVDAGSTYQIDALFHGELSNGNCTDISERKASSDVYAFTDEPTSYPNSIEAVVKRDIGEATLAINVSWPYLQTVVGCSNASFDGENATGLGCTGLGLAGKLVGDQIDMACVSLNALTTVSGILTIGD